MTTAKITEWIPTTNLMMLRRMGKLSEELGELQAIAARCIIQGIDEVDPGTKKVNRLRLEHELADVLAQCEITITQLGLNAAEIDARKEDKKYQMNLWENMFGLDLGAGLSNKTEQQVRDEYLATSEEFDPVVLDQYMTQYPEYADSLRSLAATWLSSRLATKEEINEERGA